jgi:DNA-binding beta-propeller fold protein YncE
VALVTALALLFAPIASSQDQNCPTRPPIDNRDGYFVNFEEAPVHPMELSADGSELWVVNIPDASVVVYDVAAPTQLVPEAVVKVGLGPVTVRLRPASEEEGHEAEMWVVCQSSNAVFIIDPATKRVVETIRLVNPLASSGSEPAGLVFNAAGTKAWVTLSAIDQVLEIDTASRTVTKTLEFDTPFPAPAAQTIHAEEPRALLLDGNTLYALSNESGNGSTGLIGGIIDDETIVHLWNFAGALGVPAPDLDLLQFDVSLPGTPAGSAAHWRLGTLNFDIKKGPGSTVWVSNMDANNHLVGEHAFKAGMIAQHRLSIGTPPAPWNVAPAVLDLNDPANLSADVPDDYACAMPNEMAFTADQQRLYVACYETHNVAVVDTASRTVVGELRGLTTLPGGDKQNFGVRGLVLREAANVLYTYTRDNRVQVYTLPIAGAPHAPVSTVAVGFDITSRPVRQGRFLNIDATRSASSVQSCNTCHVDGHMDRVAWDLSDFTGDPLSNPPTPPTSVPRVPKRTKVTMSLRGIEETPPFHWRGDRADLDRFNPAFEGLLGGTQLSPQEMADFEAFVFSLSYPANPRQNLDRSYSQPALAGFSNFACKPAHDIGFDNTTAVTAISCSECHSMTGASGTNNQVNNDLAGTFPIIGDATQLRGLFDKRSDVIDYTGTVLPAGHLQRIPATGWGFGNSGFTDRVKDFVDLGVFHLLTQAERDDVTQFLDEFDTGVAPAAAFAWTLHATTAGQPVAGHPFNTLLRAQATAGHINLVVRGWMIVGGVARPVGMLYDAAANNFQTYYSSVGTLTYTDLVTRAASNRGVFTLMGVPRGMGYRLGLDEEMDFLLDGDEAGAGATLGQADSDGDGFPDGYETRFGADPGDAANLPPAEAVAPAVSGAVVSWVNGSVAKVRWRTDEESRSRIEVFPPGGGPPAVPVAVKEERQFKKSHVLVVRGLPPGQNFDVHVVTEDPAASANQARHVIPNAATPAPLFANVHIKQTTLTFSGANATAAFELVDELGVPLPGATVAFQAVEWIPGSGNATSTHTTAASNALGIAQLTFATVNGPGAGAILEVFADDVTDVAGTRLYFHPLDGQFGFWKQEPVP